MKPLDPHRPAIYFYGVQDLFKEAQMNASHFPDFFFKVDRFIIRLVFAGESLYPELTRVFSHLRIISPLEADLTVFCWDSVSTSSSIPWTPSMKKPVGRENDIFYFNSDDIYFSYNHTSGILNMLNTENNTGIFWIEDYRELPLYEITSAFKNLINWWFYRKHFYLVHSAAVGVDGRGVLIAGKGKTGKSTTAMACFQDGMAYAGDDYVLLSKETEFRISSLYSAVKLEDNEIFQTFGLKMESCLSDPFYKKKILFLNDLDQSRMADGFLLRALVIPRINNRSEMGLRVLPPAQAFREMAPSSLFQQMGHKVEVVNFLAELTRNIPCYRLTLSRDIHQIPGVIKTLISDS